jgi:hypothetical protein
LAEWAIEPVNLLDELAAIGIDGRSENVGAALLYAQMQLAR